MKFVADENIDLPIIPRLRKDRHEVNAVIELAAGILDNEVLKLANVQGFVLLTAERISGRWFIAINVTLVELFFFALQG